MTAPPPDPREEGRDALDPLPLLVGPPTEEELTRTLLAPSQRRAGWIWWGLFLASSGGVGLYVAAIVWLFLNGIGVLGNNIPVAWAFPITNLVWWIGFGHAGTLISAILVLFQQKWRASINRFAEAMTICAVIQAGMFPILHLGRPEYAYWIVPYPSSLAVWPQFRSALTWDAGAIATYLLVSLLFWYLGLIPDFAAARDRAPTKGKRLFWAAASLGWRSSQTHWHHWRSAYLLVAALGTALVVSVESIISMDFSIAQLPGWHTTIFPPYYVASAMFGGFALLLCLLVPARAGYRLEHVITEKHLDVLNRMVLLFSWFVSYGYLQENFFAWYGSDRYEIGSFAALWTGRFAWLWWACVATTTVLPQTLWVARLRTSRAWSVVVGAGVVLGVWLEQFTHIVPPLSHDFLPSSWRPYGPTWVDLALTGGSMAFFLWLFLLFLKLVPAIPLSDLKEVRHELGKAAREGGAPAEDAEVVA